MMEKDKLPKGLLSIAWILVLGALPPMLDSTIVNIAVNDLAKVFSASFVVTQWVVTGYVLALGMAVPFSGWLMQKYDGKKVYMYALGLFLISSLLSGFAWNIESLIAFRVLQGIASGIIIPTLTTLVAQAAGGENIGRLMSVVGIPVVFGPIAGPVIGGLILQHSEWQWLFFVNLPVGALALIIAQWKLPKFEAGESISKTGLDRYFVVGDVIGNVYLWHHRDPGGKQACSHRHSGFGNRFSVTDFLPALCMEAKERSIDPAGSVSIQKFQCRVLFPVPGRVCHQRTHAAFPDVFSKCTWSGRDHIGVVADSPRLGDAGGTAVDWKLDG